MIRTSLFACLMVLTAALIPRAYAFECPAPQPTTRPGVIPESAVQISDLSALLGSGDMGNRVGAIVHNLRETYPTAENAEIVNYLMGAFCPLVRQLNGLGDAEKQARMDQFTREVVARAY